MKTRRRLLRIVGVVAAVVLILFISFSVWLWNWNPVDANLESSKLAKVTLTEAIHRTTVLDTYPDFGGFEIKFIKPELNAPHVSSDAMIKTVYDSLNGYWYSGNVQMYYAKAVGGPVDGKTVWIVENHMLFPHSQPAVSSSHWWYVGAWKPKYRNLCYALGLKQRQATSFSFYDAKTAKFLGAARSENF